MTALLITSSQLSTIREYLSTNLPRCLHRPLIPPSAKPPTRQRQPSMPRQVVLGALAGPLSLSPLPLSFCILVCASLGASAGPRSVSSYVLADMEVDALMVGQQKPVIAPIAVYFAEVLGSLRDESSFLLHLSEPAMVCMLDLEIGVISATRI